jgi:hypothetical protein
MRGLAAAGAFVLVALGWAIAAGGTGIRLVDAVLIDAPSVISGVAAADVTGDGVGDVTFGPVGSGPLRIHAGTGDGGFASPVDVATGVSGSSAHRLLVAELNGDGVDDLVVGWYGRLVTIVLSDGAGGHSVATSRATDGSASEAEWPAVVDWDGDGDLDVVTASSTGMIRVRWNDGAGAFSSPSTLLTSAPVARNLAAGDLDGDGAPDLALAVVSGVRILWNDGGVLTASELLGLQGSLPTYGVEAADFDGDGLQEVAFTWSALFGGYGLSLFHQASARTFDAPLSTNVAGHADVLARDINGDGFPELVTEGEVFVNRGDGTFGSSLRLPPVPGVAAAVGDVIGDGRPDVVVASLSEGRLYEVADPRTEPIVDAVTPSTLLRGQTATLRVDGSGFDVGITAGTGPGVSLLALRRLSRERVEADVAVSATAPLGRGALVLSVPSGCLASAEYVVWDGAAVVTALEPSVARPGDTLEVTATGTGFVAGATAALGDGVTVNSSTVLDATRLRLSVTVAVDAAAGRRDLVVANGTGAASAAPGAFRVLPPRRLDVVVRRGRLHGTFRPGTGTFAASGSLAFTEDGAFDPAAEPVRLVLGSPASSLVVDIPAQAGWSVRGRRARWRSARDASPRVALDLDRRRGTFRIAVVRADLWAPRDGVVLVELRLGGDEGRSLEPWTIVRPGTLALK